MANNLAEKQKARGQPRFVQERGRNARSRLQAEAKTSVKNRVLVRGVITVVPFSPLLG
jgi:hypothetical protein